MQSSRDVTIEGRCVARASQRYLAECSEEDIFPKKEEDQLAGEFEDVVEAGVAS